VENWYLILYQIKDDRVFVDGAYKGGFGAYLVGSAYGGRFVNRPYGF
jgi:hypothetical protein